MMLWLVALLGGVAAYLVAYGMLPWAIRLAPHIGAVDVPRDGRRMHNAPTPRTGGIAIFVAFAVATVVSSAPAAQRVALLWGATLLVLLGVFDDIYRLPAPLKLIVQLLSAAVALGHGGGWSSLPLGHTVSLPVALRFLLGVLWTVVLINAHNMIDGLDGLAASIAGIESLGVSIVLLLQGEMGYAALALALGGACAGYLPYNRHPARVFMGDAGSQLLGLVLGVLSLHVDLPSGGALGALVPFLLFSLPLSDLAFAVVRRLAKGQSPFAADRGHWHHRLVDRGWGQRRACRWLSLMCAALGAIGVLLAREEWYPYAAYATLAAVAVVMMPASVNPQKVKH